ncbi:Calcium-channel protein cch1, partial [Armadillidium vulgare]
MNFRDRSNSSGTSWQRSSSRRKRVHSTSSNGSKKHNDCQSLVPDSGSDQEEETTLNNNITFNNNNLNNNLLPTHSGIDHSHCNGSMGIGGSCGAPRRSILTQQNSIGSPRTLSPQNSIRSKGSFRDRHHSFHGQVIAQGLLYGSGAYFSSGWNIMDGTLVLISVVDILMSLIDTNSHRIFGILRVFRLLRALRPLRVINRAPGLKLALMALFVLSSKDGWVNIMYTGLDAVGVDKQPKKNYSQWRLLYFISFLLLVGFFVLNMFVGVVVENFHRCREEQEKEEKARRAAKRAKKIEKKRRSM